MSSFRAAFASSWTAQVLPAPPLIVPARQFVYPRFVSGEEDAMARGALLVTVKPAVGANFLATCALGFREPTLPTGIFACPDPDDLLAIAGGYAYLLDTLAPDDCLHLPLRPVAAVLPAPEAGLLLLAGFHHVLAVAATGIVWQTERLSWEGITLQGIEDGRLHGSGWNLQTDREVAFTVDLANGQHKGGGFTN